MIGTLLKIVVEYPIQIAMLGMLAAILMCLGYLCWYFSPS